MNNLILDWNTVFPKDIVMRHYDAIYSLFWSSVHANPGLVVSAFDRNASLSSRVM